MGYPLEVEREQIENNILSIPFMGYITYTAEAAARHGSFQFPLWDTEKPVEVKPPEKPPFQFPLWDTYGHKRQFIRKKK